MIRRLLTVALAAPLTAIALSSCATVQKLDAAGDVHALLIAIRDDDRATFDALVDRRALTLELEARLRAEARRDSRIPTVLSALLAPTVANIAGEALIRPSVFRAVAQHYGYDRSTKIPGPIGISTTLKQLPDGRVCATKKKDGPCLLTFSQYPDGRWKLSGFDGELSMLRLKL